MQREPLADRARGRWAAILPQLGVSPSALTGKHGPCPLCGGRDRFRFDDKEFAMEIRVILASLDVDLESPRILACAVDLATRLDARIIGIAAAAPPVAAAGYVSASGLADSCLLVVEAGRTRTPVVRRAMEEIEAAGGKLQGVVLNRRKHYIPSWIYRRL